MVRDLDTASEPFARLGFRFKEGRLHENGLLNRHIKFRDGTELELMTVRGEAGDSMARNYRRLLREGEGGVFAALKVPDLRPIEDAAERLGLPVRRSGSGPWRFLSFPPPSDASAVFFGSGWTAPADPDSIFQHGNPATTLEEAWIEGGPSLEALLREVGARACGPARLPDGKDGTRWILGRGSLVVVPFRGPAPGPRLRGVAFGANAEISAERRGAVEPLPGFWIRFGGGD